jgi:cell division protease FtsH
MSDPDQFRAPRFGRSIALCIVVGLLLVALFNLFSTSHSTLTGPTLAFSDFMSDLSRGQVSDAILPGRVVSGHFKDGHAFTTVAPVEPALFDELRSRDVNVALAPVPDENMPSLSNVIVQWLPMLLLIGVWVYFMRQMRRRQPGPGS